MKVKQNVLLIWVLLRLPLLGLVLYFFRDAVLTWVENWIGLGIAIDSAVYLASTLSSRLLLSVACLLALYFVFWLTQKIVTSISKRYFLFLIVSSVGIYISFTYAFKTSDALLRAGLLVFFLAINTLPHEWLAQWIKPNKIANTILITSVGLVEIFIPQLYSFWLSVQFSIKQSLQKTTWLIGLSIACLYWIFLLIPPDNHRIFTLGTMLFATSSTEKFEDGEFNWIELNKEHDLLYAVGRSTRYLLAYDINDLNVPALRSKDEVGRTQSFAFNPVQQELYVYKHETSELFYLDALTLETKKIIPLANLSIGDVWISWDAQSDSIVIASEADIEAGIPLILLDRESGENIASLPLPWIATNIALHPEQPVLYFNSFKDTYLAAWDLSNFEIIQQTTTRPNTDRLIYDPLHSEVLVASLADGTILRYDAKTLAFLGEINSTFGVRTLTIDSQRNLLLTGNFINNQVEVIDLTSYQLLESFYVGPWIRTIVVDTQTGIAYVSSVRGLFRLEYTNAND